MNNYRYLQELDITAFMPVDYMKAENLLVVSERHINYLVVLTKTYDEQHLSLLNKILDSIKIIDPDTRTQIVLQSILDKDFDKYSKFNKLIYFGDDIDNFDSVAYNQLLNSLKKVYNINDNRLLIAPSIAQLALNQNLKKQLWQKLQTFCK